MKRLAILTVLLLASLAAGAADDWKGRVVDENGNPVGYATVALLSKTDSTVVSGTFSAEDGTFNMITDESDGILMVSMLGYETRYLVPENDMVVTLTEDASLLQGAMVSTVMPKTELTGEGLQTNVRGSVLENAGTASDVLAKTPGIIRNQNGIEVIGKGAPLVYINGRKVTDSSELDRLQSSEIQSVEVITNPGAQYDATVNSVVRIRTIRRQGDGFGFTLNASDAQSLKWAKGNDAAAALNLNYRTGGVDVFGGLNYGRYTSRQISDLLKETYGKSVVRNESDMLNEYIGQNVYGNIGVNWQISDRHSVGGKLEWGTTASYDVMSDMNDDVFEDGVLVDKLHAVSNDKKEKGTPYNLGANLYYSGRLGAKLGLDVNLDYYGTDDAGTSITTETSEMTHDAEVRTANTSDGRLYAAKAVFSYPVWKGQLQVGTEETFSRRSDEYSVQGVSIPSSSAHVTEDNYAGFLSYGVFLGKFGQASAGLRYEYVHYAYEDAMAPENDLTRNYGSWFPSLSYAAVAGPVQLMLNYSVKTVRPNFALLSSAIRYNNRYVWQSGNAQLQPQTSHNVSATAMWKFITFMVNYVHTDDAIMTWSSPYGDDGVVLVKPQNVSSPYRMMSAYVNLTPTIGPWTLNYTLGIMPQWLTIDVEDPREESGVRRTVFNNKPICFAQLQNTFTLGRGWQLEVGGLVQSKGYSQNLLMTNVYFDLTAAVQKTLLKDNSLVLRLEGANLAGMAHANVDTDFGSHIIRQTNLLDNQKVKLSIRYNFNAAQSKYRGTGAGTDTKSRMK